MKDIQEEKMKLSILGIPTSIDGSSMLSTKQLYDLVGHNTGNLAFHYAINKMFGGKLESTSWYAKPEQINASGDFGIVPCANQLGPHVNYAAVGETFAQLDMSIAAIGLGAQSDSQYGHLPDVPDGTLHWVREMMARSRSSEPNVGVRGPFTLKVLEKYGLADKAVVLGCPTLFINPDPNLGQIVAENAKKPFARVAVAGGHQRWTHLARLEASLVKIMEETGGSYIIQSPLQMAQIARKEASELSEADLIECRDYTSPGMPIEEYEQWTRRYARAFFDISSWMEYLRNFDFVIGPRIHGVMLGLQAGIPSLCLAHDSRTRELCEVMGVPFVMAGSVIKGIKREDLPELFKFDAAQFDENRRQLADRFKVFFTNNGLADASKFFDGFA